jgi:radical SAM protein with 4Fe4S-binding SPASM domain
MPCVGIPIAVGNIREAPLRTIIDDSEVIQNLRNFTETIKGPCATCEKAGECYGCRGAAYNLTGDYLASDPMCWHNVGREHQISHLPVEAGKLIPHADPFLLVDTLETVGERTATARARVARDTLFVDEAGRVDECAFPEMIAQTAAAMTGFKDAGDVQKGFVVGSKGFEICGGACADDLLEISVRKVARFEDFGIVEGRITRDGEMLARGEIKIWGSPA